MSIKSLSIAIIDPVGQKAGMDTYDLELARNLISLGCKVNIYSNFSSAGDSFVHRTFNFTFRKNPFQLLRYFIQFLLSLRKSRASKSDFVLLHIFHSKLSDYFFIWLTRWFGFRICLVVHDLESFVYSKRSNFLEKCIEKSALVIVHNQVSYDELVRITSGKYNGRIQILPHGNFINHPPLVSRELVIDYFNLEHSKKYILFFGMLKKSKGLDVLLQAFREIDGDWQLIIAGRERDESLKNYERILNHPLLSGRVHSIHRYITNKERHFLLSSCDMVILPYRKIYQSGVMLLAMSYGLPVIASDLPANKEIINGENGILFQTGNAKDLAEKMNLLINDESKRISIREKSIAFMIQKHDWNAIAGKLAIALTNLQ